MTNRGYTAKVDAGDYPNDPVVPLDDPFINENGRIQNLLLERFTSAAVIGSKAGAVRANHYHRTDWHYTYVVVGAVDYFWRTAGSKNDLFRRRFDPGALFFTPPMVEHAMFFPVGSTIITFAKNVRDHEHHEADVVRVRLVEAVRNGLAWTYRIL